MAVIRRRLSNNIPKVPFQPGNQHARGIGRPPGSRNKTTNLMVEGIKAAILHYGRQYLTEHDMAADTDMLSEAELFGGFMIYLADKDLRAFASIIKGLIPRDVTITMDSQHTVEVLAPQQLREVLEQKGLRLPPSYQLTANHGNDDDAVTEADIARVLEQP